MDIALDEPPDGPRKNALQKIQEQLAHQMAPIHKIKEMEKLLTRPSPGHGLVDFYKQFDVQHLRQALDQTAMTSQAQKIYDHYFQKNAFLNLGVEQGALMKSLTESVVQREYEKFIKPLTVQQNFLEKINFQALSEHTFADHYAKQLKEANTAFSAMDSVRKQMDAMLRSFRDIDFRSIEDVSEEVREEAQEAADSITKSATAEPTMQAAMEKILAFVEAQENPSVRVMLLFYFKTLLGFLIAGAIGTVMSHYAPAVLGNSPQAATKAVKEVAREVVGPPELLVDYRYVSTKVLLVRENPRALSPEIARLTFGKPVKLVKKEKDFALVVWSDKESGAEIQGWVFARYLSKFG